MAEETNHKWFNSFLTPQTFAYILAGIVSLVIFYVNQNNTTKDVTVIKHDLFDKVDKKDYDAIDGRVSRQYEQFNRLSDRITALEKEIEFQKGVHEEMDRHTKK